MLKIEGPILKGALDTLNAALHLRRSSWLQHQVKAGQRGGGRRRRRGAAPSPLLSFTHRRTWNMQHLQSTPSMCACYSLSACMGDVWRHCVFTVHDHGESLTVISLLEGGLAAYQHEEDHAETPDIWGTGKQTQTRCESMCTARLLLNDKHILQTFLITKNGEVTHFWICTKSV